MTLDHLREIALIQISQAQRTNAMIYEGTEAFYPNGDSRVGWCFAYWHNGRLLRSITTYWSNEAAKTAGRAFCNAH